ncbi:chloride channel protein [Methylobacterium sp. SyP6R]|uniref:chloride channel protein n=1 Tax=Methylobacterium sp. SyP6R TaxID=2718876 RepID=UPI001F34B6A7|nr:chloride channel protein [Methylobacterium sp. SyP6R]MCF4127725.1 chloride channel protein [Methylobacterium sp. SyP6R]
MALRRAAAWRPSFVLRRLVRQEEILVALLSGLVGFLAGLVVAAMVLAARAMHVRLFGLPSEALSGAEAVAPWQALLVPALGGLLLGGFGILLARYRRTGRIVDPIEANALHGGRISGRDSLIVVAQTLLSNGFGASVGMEAGYTQAAGALASKLGRAFRLRRSDMRVIVGAGTAGAIAAAFDAPLTGAFYAFELVIGAYAIGSLAPVAAASICAVGAMRLLVEPSSFQIGFAGTLALRDYAPILAMGFVCAGVAIAVMRGVPLVEAGFRRSGVPVPLQPALGGLAVGALALVTPAVLSSGHSALHVGFEAFYTPAFLVALIVLKAVASAISIGSGFRGGLFFASLFLGAMLGKLVAFAWMSLFSLQVPAVVLGIVGMSAMATAILGGPLTMAFLALETTGSLPLTIAVLAASVVASLTVRRTFGYSFATWRFHLRGESIRSALDVGWIRSLTVGRTMRPDIRTVRVDMPVKGFRREFPLGSTQRVVVLGTDGLYAGMAYVQELHDAAREVEALGEVLHLCDEVLTPEMNVKEALAVFERAEADALAVVAGARDRRVIGLLTEQHALRRYSEELDRTSRDLAPT